MTLCQSKDLEKTELLKDTQEMLYGHQKLEDNKEHQSKTDGIRNKIKKEKQENQNTLPLKSGGKRGPQKCQLFYKYEYYSYFQKFQKIHKRGTIIDDVHEEGR